MINNLGGLYSWILPCFLFSFLIFTYESPGQDFGSLRGFVTDSTNGEALAFGNILIEEIKIGASTDERGYFFINRIPANKNFTVRISYVGYNTKEITAFIATNKITQIDIQLAPSSFELEAIEKVGERIIEKNATDIGLQRISIRELETLPKGVETDLFRSLQSLPGVRTTGDVSARYYVRGGAGNQNLVLLNGAVIYNPFHALGLFSVIDPEMINSIEFYKGGFSADYGTRLSSVLSIITKDGNKKNYGAKFSSSYLTGKGLVEGPIPNGSFLITGRKSYSNEILKKFFNDQTVPADFYDLSFKINYSNPDLYKNAKFIIFGFTSQDKLDNKDQLIEDYKWSNDVLGFQWLQIYDSPLYSTFSISASKFKGEVIPNLSTAKLRNNTLSDFGFSMDLTYIYDSKDELGFGFGFKKIDTKLTLENNAGIPSNIDAVGGNLSVFGKYKFLRFDNFGVDVGSRVNLGGLSEGGSFFLEPRISMTYRPLPWLALKGAWGIYLQELTTVSDENEVISLFEPWVITPEYLDPASAIHYIGGLDIDISEKIAVGVEGYYKIINNLPLINEDKTLAFEPDLVAGSGESYGWEFSTKYINIPVSITVSYSLSWAYTELDDRVYFPKYDSRHTVNTILEYNFGSGWTASLIWNYNTGLPFTELVGYYDKAFVNNVNDPILNNISFLPYSILGDRNIGRLPDYHRLDFSLSKKFNFGFLNLYADFSIINVYDRKNIFYFERDTGERVNMLPILPTATVKIEI